MEPNETETPVLPADTAPEPPEPIPEPEKPRTLSYLFTVQWALGLLIAIAFFTARLIWPESADAALSQTLTLIRTDLSFAPQMKRAAALLIETVQEAASVTVSAAEAIVIPDNATTAPVLYTGAATFPLMRYDSVSSPFGTRIHPITGEADFHEGVDLPAPKGTRIFAAADGVVVASGYDKTAGNYIRIDHGGGFLTLYAHCDSLIAEKGMHLRGGDVIAYVGTTGSSTGYHLHFAAQKDGVWFDPAYLFEELGGGSLAPLVS